MEKLINNTFQLLFITHLILPYFFKDSKDYILGPYGFFTVILFVICIVLYKVKNQKNV